jgi:hypothetical protein
MTCAWCPDFDRHAAFAGESHGICQACSDRMIFDAMKRPGGPVKKHDAIQKAAELWATFSDSEKHGVRFGMFPAEPMAAAETAGIDGHELVLALMACAARDGGMRA